MTYKELKDKLEEADIKDDDEIGFDSVDMPPNSTSWDIAIAHMVEPDAYIIWI